MKVLVDMNLSPGWVNFLAEAGFEAVHWSDVGAGSAPDSELMQWAAERGFVVLTADLDFGAILATTQGRRPDQFRRASGSGGGPHRACRSGDRRSVARSRRHRLRLRYLGWMGARRRGCGVGEARQPARRRPVGLATVVPVNRLVSGRTVDQI